MYIDSRLEFADNQSITASAACTNLVDLGAAEDKGVGRPLYVVITLDAAPESDSADETYTVAIETDDNEAFSSALELVRVTIPRGSAQGDQFVLGFPQKNTERYVRLYATIGGTIGGTGLTLSAHLTDQEPRGWKAYPDAI